MKTFLFSLALTLALPAALLAQPKGKFPIGGFSPNAARDLAEGFTIGGPVYKHAQKALAECEAAGLPFIYPIGSDIDFHGKKSGAEPTELDFAAISEELREQVKAAAGSDAIHAWYLKPEELRYWKPLEMEYLKIASEAIREADPRKRPIWHYQPNHRGAAAMEKVVPYMQIAGKGLYANYSNRANERGWITWSMEQQRKGIEAANPEALPYAILEMFRTPEETGSIRSWVRHDSYSALLGGAKGIVIYSFAKRKNFTAWDAYYAAYAEVAKELNGQSALGDVFLKGKEAPPPRWTLKSGPETTLLSKRDPKIFPEAIALPSLQAKAWHWNGTGYLFLINSSPEPLQVKIEGGEGWVPFAPQQTRHISGDGSLELDPWEVAIFLQPSWPPSHSM